MSQTGMKVVARYVDRRLIKGTTYDFQRGRPRFHVFPEPRPSDATAIGVTVSDLKAVFFVRDLVGDPRVARVPGRTDRATFGLPRRRHVPRR